MNGARVVALGDVVEVVGGGTPPKNNPRFYGGPIPWATVRDMNVDRIISTEHSITPEGLRASSSRIIPAGEVVIATRVGLGKACVLGRDTAINQDLRGLIPKSSTDLDRAYLLYWYRSIADQVVAAGTGATVQGVKLPFIKALPLPLPPLDEQKRIVAVLDEAFNGLDQVRSNVTANLRDIREVFSSATQQLLSDDPTTKLHRLGSVVDRLTNGYVGPTRGIYLDAGVPYLLARHVRDNVLAFDGRTFVSQQFNEKHRKSKLKAGDVLLVQSGHIGHCAVVTEEHEGHNCHAMIVLTPKPGMISGQYMSALFNTPAMQAKFQEIRTGSTVPHLTCGMVKELMIPAPSIERQESLLAAFSAFERATQEAADSYLAELDDLRTLRSVLLESAFSGELT